MLSCDFTLYSTNDFQNAEVIVDDGAPTGRKDFVIWNPPPNDPIEPTLGRHSSLKEATSLMRFLMKKGVRTILFCKVRQLRFLFIHDAYSPKV